MSTGRDDSMSRATAKQPIIVDVDTGVDDAAALVLAARLDSIDLIGVTTVAGNVSLDHTTENTLRVLAAAGRESIPVFRGMSAPLVRPARDASHFHGTNGLGDVELPPSASRIQPTSAPDFIVQTGRKGEGDLTLVCLGPLTNLAVALNLEPNLPGMVRRVVVMGGAFLTRGNATPFAEYNIWADPEAAAAVVQSDLPLTFVGLDVTHQTLFTRAAWERLAASQGSDARLISTLFRRTFVERGAPTFPLHDPLAVGVAHRPTVVRTEKWSVAVATGFGTHQGETSLMRSAHHPEHEVALGVDVHGFLSLFSERLGLG